MHTALLHSVLLVHALFANRVAAQFPPEPEGVKVIKSLFHEGVTVSYKEPGICETTPGVKSYSGYVHLPPHSLNESGESQDYPINTFFWFFEARKDPHRAPLSIWLNGGPGGSSIIGMLQENGPCFVNEDSNSTRLNSWSWNNEVNMLYIDQPVQVGYSYDVPTNGTKIFSSGELGDDAITPADFSDGVPEQNNTFQVGTFGSQNWNHTANSTNHAAIAMWHFAQTWFEEFPVYKPHDEKISLWTESYGGKYGPAFVSFFSRQNEKIANGTISGPGTHYIHLDTLGIINGCIDHKYQLSAYVDMRFNNTYGIKAINETFYHGAKWILERPGGLLDSVEACQKAAREGDPNEIGNDDKVNGLCSKGLEEGDALLIQTYMESQNYGWFDITHPAADPFPEQFFIGYLNQHWVQKALGVPVNHTWASSSVSRAFDLTGDMARGGLVEDIAYLLDSGTKVAMAYGDRDYACNWIGGERASLNVPYSQLSAFTAAGYQPLTVAAPTEPPFQSYGLVRQHGNFSFTRVYQAGHMVPSYQPQAALEIFQRSLFNRDIATGTQDITTSWGASAESDDDVEIYQTSGPGDTWWMRNEVLPAPEGFCYIISPSTCTKEEWEFVKNGTAIIKDWIVVGVEGAVETEDLFKSESRFGRGGQQKVLGGKRR